MNRHSIRTDNKSVANKIFLRREATKHLKELRVLDLFAGRNILWRNFEKERYYGIEIEQDKGNNLTADTRRVFDSLDISQFNVIDCDSYGIAFDLYKKLLEYPLSPGTVVLYTAITNEFTQMQKTALDDFNLNEIFRKCPSLFNKRAIEYLYLMFAKYQIDQVNYYEMQDGFQKHYGYFIINS